LNLYEEIIKELENRKVAYARQFAPFYISSIATHVFNIANQRKHIYMEGGLPANTRQHILFVTVPGFGKSFILRQFLDGPNSIVNGSSIQTTFENMMTEAGFVGTIGKDNSGQKVEIDGLCKEHSDSIVGIEEFSAITNSMSADYNYGLDTSLLTALDSGMVRKRLANGKLEYETHLTMWAGVQPARYNLSSGLGRRFLFVMFIPTYKDIFQFKLWRRVAKNIKVDTEHLRKLKLRMNERFNYIQNSLTYITFNQEFYKELDKLNVIHYEEPIYERLALGYWLMKVDTLYGKLTIGTDVELIRLMQLEHHYRKEVKKGTQLAQVWGIIQEEGSIEEKELVELLLDFSLDLDTSRTMIRTLIAAHYIRREGTLLINNKLKKDFTKK